MDLPRNPITLQETFIYLFIAYVIMIKIARNPLMDWWNFSIFSCPISSSLSSDSHLH